MQEKLISEANIRTLAPVKKNLILLTGTDTFRLRERVNMYKRLFAEKHPNGALEIFEDNHSYADLEGSVCTPNLFGGRRLIFCETFWDAEKGNKALEKNLISTIADQSDSVTVCIIEPKIDKRTTWSKRLLSEATVEQFDPMDDTSLMRWAARRAETQGSNLPHNCAQFLIKRCGSDLWNLSGEIDKLSMLHQGTAINKESIEQSTLRHPSLQIWDFLEALSRGQLQRALKLFEELLLSGTSVHEIFALIMREVRIHALLIWGDTQGYSSKEIAQRTGLHPFVVQKTLPLSRTWNMSRVQNLYAALLAIDHKLKTGGITLSTDDTSQLELELEKTLIETFQGT